MDERKLVEEKEDPKAPLVMRIFYVFVAIAFYGFTLVSFIGGFVFFLFINVPELGYTFSNTIVLSAVGILIMVISAMLLYIYITNKRRKKIRYTKLINEIQAEDNDVEKLDERVLERIDTSGIQRPKVVVQTQKSGMKYALNALIYKKKVSKERCQICKLEMSGKDVIVQCPICDTLFHKEHFIDWMVNKRSCPVCGEEYTVETY